MFTALFPDIGAFSPVFRPILDRPVIINGMMFFTDGTLLQFTDNTVIYFED